MLKIYRRFSELDIGQIMKIYAESLVRDYSAKELWESPEVLFLEDLRLFFSNKNAHLAVWEHEGQCVSALRLEPYKDGFLISCLETAPSHRRNGYAFAILEETCSIYRGPIYAHVAKDNLPSRNLHDRLGFVKHADHAVYVDGSVYTSVMTLVKR